jgi:NitT/TauT family transport system permease protein
MSQSLVQAPVPVPATAKRGMAGALPFRSGITLGLALLLATLLAWELLPRWLGVPSFVFPTARDTLEEALFMLKSDRLAFHTLMTALNVLVGFALGSLFGMVCGYLLGLSRQAEMIFSPYLLLLQIAPKVAFAPLLIMWFGYNLFPKILLTILMVFFPVAINVLTAVRSIDPDLMRLARSLHARRAQVFWKIQFPASLPQLMAGLRIGATLAVVGVVVAEMVGGNIGLGYLLVYGQGQARTASVFATILILTLIGVVAYVAVVLAERFVLRWRPAAS